MTSLHAKFKGIGLQGRRNKNGDYVYFTRRGPVYTKYRVIVGRTIDDAFAGGPDSPATSFGVSGVGTALGELNFGRNVSYGDSIIPTLSKDKTAVSWTPYYLSTAHGWDMGIPIYARVDQYNSVTASWTLGRIVVPLIDRFNSAMVSYTGTSPVDSDLVEGAPIPATTGLIMPVTQKVKSVTIRNTGSNPLFFASDGSSSITIPAGSDTVLRSMTPNLIQVGSTDATGYQIIFTR
jgi:hypothetical protein